DIAGNTSAASSSLSVTIDTNSPTDMALSNNTASTSGGVNAIIGALSSTDATAGDSFSYTLVAGVGDTNNASFNINGADLRVNDPAALGAGTYSVLVRTTDVAGNLYDEAQSITITTNPTVTISADDSSLKAGQTATITFTFSEAPTGFDASDITVSGGTLGAISSSSATVYTATYTPIANTQSMSETILIAADTFTASGNNNLVSNTLSMTGDTLAPTIISIDHQTPATVTTNADSLVYRVSFSEAVLAIDTADFSVTGSSATVTNVASAGGNAYDITVFGGDLASVNGAVSLSFTGGQNITDTAGNALSVTVPSGTNNSSYTLDNTAPIVSNVTVPSSTTYGLGENLNFVVNFDDNVTVDTSGGTPRIALNIGGSTVYATYLSGSGTAALTFRYTTQSGDIDTDGIVVGTLSANGGTLKDSVGNDANLTLNSVAATTAVLVNTAPTVTLATDHASIAEATGIATITATLSAVASTDTTVTLTPTGTATGSGTDYTLSSTTITITAGNTTGTATVTAVQDTTYEGNETVLLDISGVSGGDSAYESGTQQVTITITDDDAAPATPSTPTPTTTIDGATVTTTVTTGANGNTTEEVIIAAIPNNRIDQTGSVATAEVPLFWGESSRTDWATTASLPTGIGLSATGERSPQTGHTITDVLSELTAIINAVAPTNDPSKTNMLSGANDFLQTLNNVTDNLVVNQITFTSTHTTASATPITIAGTADAITTASGDRIPTEALVIDARALPSGSILELQNVEFAVVLGDNIIVRGGEGQNIIFAGDGNQDIMCGPEDDELHVGAGDDTVGSAGGDDKIFGESGNDTIFGGEGNDLLHGGSGIDVTTYSGSMSDYTITRDEGKTYVALTSNPSEVDTIINTESIQFADSTYMIEATVIHSEIATLYAQVFNKQADIDGFQYWAYDYNNGMSIGGIAISFMKIADNAWDTEDTSEHIEKLYELIIGRTSDAEGKTYWLNDVTNNHMTIENVAQCFIELLGTQQTQTDWNFSI
ncbi:MAG: Ig-like domain-containing protein, partial [Sulfurospirillaceae bacterium]|nr:Ig-like domain-containing protein [Sulfurospirillaceae bacterium]